MGVHGAVPDVPNLRAALISLVLKPQVTQLLSPPLQRAAHRLGTSGMISSNSGKLTENTCLGLTRFS